MLLISIRNIMCGPSKAASVDKLVKKFAQHALREHVCVLKIVATTKILIFQKFSDTLVILHFSNNSDIVPPSEALPNSIFISDAVAYDK